MEYKSFSRPFGRLHIYTDMFLGAGTSCLYEVTTQPLVFASEAVTPLKCRFLISLLGLFFWLQLKFPVWSLSLPFAIFPSRLFCHGSE